MTEARVAKNSPVVGLTVSDLANACDNEVLVTGIVRNKIEQMAPLPDVILRKDDIVLLEGDPEALERVIARACLELEGDDRPTQGGGVDEEIGGIQSVVGPISALIGQTAKRMALHERFNINLLAG